MQESGIAVPSTTTIDGRLAIRAAVVNHRTGADDIDTMLAAVVAIGGRRVHDASLEEPVADAMECAAAPFAPMIGVARLARRAFLDEDLAPLGTALLARARKNPADANALLDCSTVLQLRGDRDLALSVQAQAIEMQSLYSLPARQTGPGVRLLAIMGPGDLMANTPIEFLLEDLPPDLQQKFMSVAPGQVLEPMPRGDGFELCRITKRTEPDADDPTIKLRVEQRLLHRHFAELSNKHVQRRLDAVVTTE